MNKKKFSNFFFQIFLNIFLGGGEEINKESVQQRATKIFAELDCDRDGLVTYDDMIRFFQVGEFRILADFREFLSKNSDSTQKFR